MNYFIAIIVLLVFNISVSCATTYKSTSMVGSSNLFLYLDEHNSYFLEGRRESDYGLMFSDGKYYFSGDSLVLEDRIFKFRLIFDVKKNVIKARKGFQFLIGKPFVLQADDAIDYTRINYSVASFDIIDDSCRCNGKPKEDVPQSDYGLSFKGLKTSIQFKLTLKDKNQFSYTFNGHVISEGSWYTEGKCLVLNDKHLQVKFYMLFHKEGEILKVLRIPLFTIKDYFVRV